MEYNFSLFLRLILLSLAPVLLAIIFYYVNKKTKFKELNYWIKQLIFGLFFGSLAILNVYFSYHLDDFIIEISSCIPLITGFLFGGLSAIITSCIGITFRCSLSFLFNPPYGLYDVYASITVFLIAAIISCLFKKFISKNKSPFWLHGLLICSFLEVIHFLLIFITQIDEINFVYYTITKFISLEILFNCLSVSLTLITIALIEKRYIFKVFKEKKISNIFQAVLLLSATLVTIFSAGITYGVEMTIHTKDADTLVNLNLNDVINDVDIGTDNDLLQLTSIISNKLQSLASKKSSSTDDGVNNITSEELVQICQNYNVSEIDIVQKNGESGIIVKSTTKEYISFDVSSGEQSKEFLILFDSSLPTSQSYQKTSMNPDISMKYAGTNFLTKYYIMVGWDEKLYKEDISLQFILSINNRHVGATGGVFLSNNTGEIIYDCTGNNSEDSTFIINDKEILLLDNMSTFKATINNELTRGAIYKIFDYCLISFLPTSEIEFSTNLIFLILIFVEIITFTTLTVIIYLLVDNLIIKKVYSIKNSLNTISHGNLDVIVNVKGNEEFQSLSNDINSTVSTLKNYITKAENRINEELELAHQIQKSSLPSIFPPYPEKKNFDIFANMQPAKEVGGDFYDFSLIDDNHLMFLIADVSGKGIPASLFMMKTKTLIKGLIESGKDIDEAFNIANNELASNNKADMFITSWIGILNLSTGLLKYVNAGHNPPIIIKNNGESYYLKSQSNFVLAGIKNIKYKINKLFLDVNDKILLYTDGVTESFNKHGTIYGKDRLINLIKTTTNKNTSKDICMLLKNDLDRFSNEVEQSDDITMLCIKLNIIDNENSILLFPSKDNMEYVYKLINNKMTTLLIENEMINKVDIVIDEIYSNIIYYSSADLVNIIINKNDDYLSITFEDNGKKFDSSNPISDTISSSIDDKKIGGVGLLIVKKLVTKFEYDYKDNKNINTLIFKL